MMDVVSLLVAVVFSQAAPLPPIPPCEDEPRVGHVATRKFIVYLDYSNNSNCLRAELTRDWIPETASAVARPILEQYANRQAEVMRHIVIETHRDYRDARYTGEYPRYRYGEYGKLRQFDPRMFNASGVPLLAMETIVSNETMDLSSWKSDCEFRTSQAENQWVYATRKWLSENHPADFAEASSRYAQWGESDNIVFLETWAKFKDYKGIPPFVPPMLPKSPLLPLPWEKR